MTTPLQNSVLEAPEDFPDRLPTARDRSAPSASAALALGEIEASAASVPPSRTRWSLEWLKRFAVRGAAVAVFLVLWQMASQTRTHVIVNFAHVPAPTAVAQAAGEFFQSPKTPRHLLNSVRRVLMGFGLAAATAIPLGLIIGRSRLMEDVLLTPLEILRPIPGVAWIPLAILMFPTAEQSMIFICYLGAVFPILLGTIHGVEGLDKKLVHAAQTLGANTWAIFREVVLPGALPSIVTGLVIGMGTCWFLVVTAEMIAGQFGIGYFTWESYTMQKYPDIVVGMLVIGVLGMVSSAAVRWLGTRITPWQRHAAIR
jgi:NitT/TauT family transport system permease protein